MLDYLVLWVARANRMVLMWPAVVPSHFSVDQSVIETEGYAVVSSDCL
jgi:hypothetical protein